MTDAAFGYQLTDDGHTRLIACPDGFSKEHTALVGQIDNFPRLPQVRHESLLHQTGFAGKECLTGHIVVVRVRRGHIDEVYIGVGYQLGIGAVCLGDVPLAGKSLCLLQRA